MLQCNIALQHREGHSHARPAAPAFDGVHKNTASKHKQPCAEKNHKTERKAYWRRDGDRLVDILRVEQVVEIRARGLALASELDRAKEIRQRSGDKEECSVDGYGVNPRGYANLGA
jgi:hypothetical protein